MDKAEENQDKELENQDETPETETPTPEEKKPTPKKSQKLYTEDDLRERGRDDASLAQRRKELEEREGKIKETEVKLKWQPVITKYGQERADKIKEAGLEPTQIELIAELLGSKVVPIPPKADTGETSGGTGELTPELVAKMSPDEKFTNRKEIAKMKLSF